MKDYSIQLGNDIDCLEDHKFKFNLVAGQKFMLASFQISSDAIVLCCCCTLFFFNYFYFDEKSGFYCTE